MPAHKVTLVPPCTKCQDKRGLLDDLGIMPPVPGAQPQNRFILSCENCGHILGANDDITVLGQLFSIGRGWLPKGNYPPRPQSTQTGRIPAKAPSTKQIMAGFSKPAPTKSNPIHISFTTPKNRATTAPKKVWAQKEAYEANKQSATCVVCGNPTAYHPSVSVLYCKCIESLPK